MRSSKLWNSFAVGFDVLVRVFEVTRRLVATKSKEAINGAPLTLKVSIIAYSPCTDSFELFLFLVVGDRRAAPGLHKTRIVLLLFVETLSTRTRIFRMDMERVDNSGFAR